MEAIRQLGDILTPHCWMCKVDLSDAYHSIPAWEPHRRYSEFRWKGELWEYNCLPFGLADAPRAFTKVLIPVVTFLRGQGLLLLVYLDGWLIVGLTPLDTLHATETVVVLLEMLGFGANRMKSITQPTQVVPFLGMSVDSPSMMLSLHKDKLRHKFRFAIFEWRDSGERANLPGIRLILCLVQYVGSEIFSRPREIIGLSQTSLLSNGVGENSAFSSFVVRTLSTRSLHHMHQQYKLKNK